MPSGYTSEIYNGKEVSGKDFIMQCARAFGATIMMRDEPLDKPIPEAFEPDSYYSQQIEKANQRLRDVELISLAEAEARAEADYNAAVQEHSEALAKRLSCRERYERTLNEVRQWQPPTPEHVNLKDFCIKQIEESMRFDCSTDYYTQNPPRRKTAQEWLDAQRQQALQDITYHAQELTKEIQRTNERNQWIKDLRESLGHFA